MIKNYIKNIFVAKMVNMGCRKYAIKKNNKYLSLKSFLYWHNSEKIKKYRYIESACFKDFKTVAEAFCNHKELIREAKLKQKKKKLGKKGLLLNL